MSCFAGPYNRGIVTKGLVLYYDVNEPVCYSSGRTDIQDLSRNGNAGTLVNGVGYSANNGGSLVFDGVNDTIWIPNSTLLDNQNQTVLVWMKTNAISQNGFWFEKGSVNSQYSLFQEGGSIVWRHRFTDGALHSQFTSSSSNLNTTNYFMVTGTYNSSQKITYINANPITITNETRTVSTNSTGMRIGSYVSGAYWFNGNIASVCVYNRALSASEIQQNFNAHKDRFGL